ncbi:MAG: TonB-dependent receptor [Acidobacteriota bacterium]|nr:TonB-dependent receptor [Acidobacteriota bacterium]
MRSRFVVTSLSILVALALLLPGVSHAQGIQTSTIEGTVKLSDGTPAPGVTVSVSSPALQGSRTTVTGGSGEYIIKGLAPGLYAVVFTLEGAATKEAKVNLPFAAQVRQDAEMVISSLQETVLVTGEAPVTAPVETPTVTQNLTKATVDALPTNNAAAAGALANIALLSPNVNAGILSGQLQVGGGFGYDNLFLVNGVDINDSVFGNPNDLFIEDAILETQVQSTAVSAEYGRFGGGVINAVTKSGGNTFKGSVRDDRTNPSYRSRTLIEKDQGTKLVSKNSDVLSATLGGFLIKDRLWFFAAGRNTNNTLQQSFTYTGLPYNDVDKNKRGEGKLTAHLSDSQTVTGSYIKVADTHTRALLNINATPDTITTGQHPNSLLAVRYDGVLSSSLFAELQYSEKKFEFLKDGGTNTDPVLGTPIIGPTLGIVYNAPYFDANDPESRNNKQYGGSLSYFLSTTGFGSHDLKVGGEEFKNIRTGGNSQSPTHNVLITDPLLDAKGHVVLDSGGHAIPVFTPGTSFNIIYLANIGSIFDSKTDSLYINDSWHMGDHFTFNLGVRGEKATNTGTDNIKTISGSRVVPRLAASYDPEGKGRLRFNATYAEYAGIYNLGVFTGGVSTGNPSYIYGLYTGPAGQGRGFAPGFDPHNYQGFLAANPVQNVSFGKGAKSPLFKEYTLGTDYVMGRDGYLRFVYQNRKASDLLEAFTSPSLGTTEITVQGVDGGKADNIVFKNANISDRKFEALIFQGQYRVLSNWSFEGNWTHQLKNDGNYEGQAGQTLGPAGIGKYPEFFSRDRNFPEGHLTSFQSDVARLWTIYNWNLGRAGNLNLSLIGTHESGLTYSLFARVPLTPIQIAKDPGYAQRPQTQNIFFGKRGSQFFKGFNTLDLAAGYEIPIWKTVAPWFKFQIFNVLNSHAQISGNTVVAADPNSPKDALGLPTGFIKGPNFGKAQTNTDYVAPREYQLSLAIRF